MKSFNRESKERRFVGMISSVPLGFAVNCTLWSSTIDFARIEASYNAQDAQPKQFHEAQEIILPTINHY